MGYSNISEVSASLQSGHRECGRIRRRRRRQLRNGNAVRVELFKFLTRAHLTRSTVAVMGRRRPLTHMPPPGSPLPLARGRISCYGSSPPTNQPTAKKVWLLLTVCPVLHLYFFLSRIPGSETKLISSEIRLRNHLFCWYIPSRLHCWVGDKKTVTVSSLHGWRKWMDGGQIHSHVRLPNILPGNGAAVEQQQHTTHRFCTSGWPP